MSRFSQYIGSQFGNPRGIVGKCCCLIMNTINKAMYQNVISNISLNEQSKVLDIGYGNGYLVEKLYKCYQASIYGIDLSEDMKKSAETRNQVGVAIGKIHLSVGDCCQLGYEDDFFDAVTSINTIYFWEDTIKGLEEVFRTLKSGGIFYNVVYTKEWLQKLSYTQKGFKFLEQEDFIKLGKQVGFIEVSIQDIVKGKSFMVVYKK